MLHNSLYSIACYLELLIGSDLQFIDREQTFYLDLDFYYLYVIPGCDSRFLCDTFF